MYNIYIRFTAVAYITEMSWDISYYFHDSLDRNKIGHLCPKRFEMLYKIHVYIYLCFTAETVKIICFINLGIIIKIASDN